MNTTGIEWTDMSWSPVIGCSRISPGCGGKSGVGGCYAERLAAFRLGRNPQTPKWHGLATVNENGDPRWTGEVRFLPERLDEPLRKRKPQRIFVCDMSDMFHERVTNEQIAAIFGVMAACPQHTFQVLTKRAERLPLWFEWLEKEALSERKEKYEDYPIDWLRMHVIQYEVFRACGRDDLPSPQKLKTRGWPLPNVHLGVSVEDKRFGLPRIEHLRRTPAALRFLSIEPLLEDLGEIDLTGIGWVIVGGESGLGARKMDPAWARSIRDQCIAAGVPFFFKQWGGVRKKVNGRLLDGRTWDELPKTTEKSK